MSKFQSREEKYYCIYFCKKYDINWTSKN